MRPSIQSCSSMRGNLPHKRHVFRHLFSTPLTGHWPLRASSHSTSAQGFSFSTKGSQDPEEFAVIGGGISGLATAYYLSQARPQARITLYEASDRIGGWIKSPVRKVNGGHVRFENGPHTLRPNSGPRDDLVLDLIGRLGLVNKVIATSKDAPAARNRYVYYPDRLVKIPGAGASTGDFLRLVREPLFKGVLPGILKEPFRSRGSLEDESIGSFLERRFSASLRDNLASAMLHGIYAGNVNDLSLKALLPRLQWLEKTYGSVLLGASTLFLKRHVQGQQLSRPCDQRLKEHLWAGGAGLDPEAAAKLRRLRGASVITFQDGLETLPLALEKHLQRSPLVSLQLRSKVSRVSLADTKQKRRASRSRVRSLSPHCFEELTRQPLRLDICNSQAGAQTPVYYDKVIYTAPYGLLMRTISPEKQNHGPLGEPPVSVATVNLFYSNPTLLPVRGFGYLIPRSVPLSQNPELALGVLFDSETTHRQDTAAGTKLTVIFGGHWWPHHEHFSHQSHFVTLAKNLLKRHLNITEDPAVALVSRQFYCIPQYAVNHCERMVELHQVLKDRFRGGLRVAGGYSGVGVNDCIRSAFETVQDLVSGRGETGLESFLPDNDFDFFPTT